MLFLDTEEAAKESPVLADDRYTMPELLIPNRKPVGPVEIDEGHPLATGLVAAYLFKEESSMLDLLNKHSTTDMVGHPVLFTTAKGRATLFDGVTDGYQIADHADLNVANEDFMFAIGLTPKAINQDAEILEKQSGNPMWQLIAQTSGNGNNYWFQVRDSGSPFVDVKSTTTLQVDNYVDIVCHKSVGTGKIEMWVNGKKEASVVDSSDGNWVTSVPLKVGYGNSNNFYGVIHYLYIWKSPKSSGSAKAISINPYQFLKPATHNPYKAPHNEDGRGFMLPESRYEMPELLIPNRKPVGKVQIDWDNTLTDSLWGCYLHNSLSTVNDIAGTTKEGEASIVGTSMQIKGGHIYFNRVAYNYIALNDAYTSRDFTKGNSSKTTVLHRFRYDSTVTGGHEFTLSANIKNNGAPTDASVATTAYQDDQWHTIAVSCDGVTGRYLMVLDGVILLDEVLSVGANDGYQFRLDPHASRLEWYTFPNVSGHDGIRIGANQSSSNDWFSGPIASSMFWQRALGANELQAITKNPYQFLIPA